MERVEKEASPAKEFRYFVVRKADKLLDGDHEFRFFGLAAPNMQQNESQLRTDMANRFPDEFEIRDLFGGLVTRTFTLSISTPADSGLPVYVSARRTYNEEAYRCLDRIIALASEYDIRLIIPFIASQSFRGIRGVDEFSALSGKPKGSFWTDEEVKADFESTDEVMDAILALDDLHRAGKISDQAYQNRRNELKDIIKEIN